MAVGDNECIPLYEPGSRVTAHCEAAVIGKRFVDISDPMQSGPGLSATSEGGNIVVSPCAAAAKALGVAAYDQAIGGKVGVLMSGMIVPVTCSAAITAGAEVEVATGGKAVTLSTGKAVGKAVSTTAGADVDVFVKLY
jgi:hypothetical protein